MTRDEKLELLRRYYDACSNADVDAMIGCFHPEVVHYFLAPNIGSKAVDGAEHLARYWRKVATRIAAVWIVDRFVADGDECVIEWSLFWTPDGADGRVLTRGAEWFVLEGDRIKEIRSYYHQLPETTELDGYPYAERGYSIDGHELSDIHEPRLEAERA